MTNKQNEATNAHKQRQQLHAARRLREHYRRKDARIVRGAVLQMIHGHHPNAMRIAQQTDDRSVWLVIHDSWPFFLVYSKVTDEIVTYLTKEAGLRKMKQHYARQRRIKFNGSKEMTKGIPSK